MAHSGYTLENCEFIEIEIAHYNKISEEYEFLISYDDLLIEFLYSPEDF